MKAIILAAGVGSRLRPLTDNTPKSLLPVGGKPILKRAIENLQAVGIKDILVITGYEEEKIKSFLSQEFPGLMIQFKRNDLYDITNTGYSLLLAREFAEGDGFIKFDADVVFEKALLQKLLTGPKTALCIDRNIHLEKEEVKVILDNEGKVLKVGKKLDSQRSNGESIGIEKLGKEAGKVLFAELSRLMEDKNNYQEYYDDSYTTLVQKGVPFYALDITGLTWVEIDTHEDYQRAQELFS